MAAIACATDADLSIVVASTLLSYELVRSLDDCARSHARTLRPRLVEQPLVVALAHLARSPPASAAARRGSYMSNTAKYAAALAGATVSVPNRNRSG